MSLPRIVLPGKTYMLTRRCFGRHFFLRPSRQINRVVKFCLAVSAERFGCQVHAFCFLSNHFHMIVTDEGGRVPEFMHWFNEFVAKCINAELGRWESFWAPGSYSRVELLDRGKLVDGLVYVFVNPVDAGLVPTHTQWPGANSLPADTAGRTEIVKRPEGFFRSDGTVPETATLRVVPPAVLEQEGPGWCEALAKRVAARESQIRRRLREKGKSFLGRRQVLKQSPFGVPRGVAPRRGLNPRVGAVDKWRRLEALDRLKSFIEDYRRAWFDYSSGELLAVFPEGTYWLRVRFGVQCAGP